MIFRNASFDIERGKKVVIIAPNGAGKTTLLSCLYNALQPDTGSVEKGHNVAVAVFEQEQVSALNQNATILDEVTDAACSYLRPHIRSVLGALLFFWRDCKKKIKVLSGGERNRVALAKVLVQEANVLLLDEPTNHLDLLSKQVLAEALQRYQGTVLFVSHDRDIVEQVADTIISLDDGMVTLYPGTYSSFLFARSQEDAKKETNLGTVQETVSVQKLGGVICVIYVKCFIVLRKKSIRVSSGMLRRLLVWESMPMGQSSMQTHLRYMM